MKKFFADSEEAFAPFYDESVIATTKEGEVQTLTVSVFDDIEGEPLMDEGSMETNRKDIQFNARQKDWYFIQKLKRGDEIEWMGKKYKVEVARNDPALGVIVKAREAD